MKNSIPPLPFKISCLVFISNEAGDNLLIKRNKPPNKGCWSPIGGKLNMHLGESPYECARRETYEEINLELNDTDIHCFGYISEKNYEGAGHWLMFLFNSKVLLEKVPQAIDEGNFNFFSRAEIDQLAIPDTDRTLLWPYFDSHKNGFIGIRANCSPKKQLEIIEEISLF